MELLWRVRVCVGDTELWGGWRDGGCWDVGRVEMWGRDGGYGVKGERGIMGIWGNGDMGVLSSWDGGNEKKGGEKRGEGKEKQKRGEKGEL